MDGAGRSLLTAAAAEDVEGDATEVPAANKSGKGTNWSQSRQGSGILAYIRKRPAPAWEGCMADEEEGRDSPLPAPWMDTLVQRTPRPATRSSREN